VLTYVRGCTTEEVRQFAELLLRLDANPVRDSDPILSRDGSLEPGIRWARFGGHRLVLQWNPVENQLRLGYCEPAQPMRKED
jgi:hypothetical protein